MFNTVTEMIKLLLKNKWLYITLIIAVLITSLISNNSLGIEGLKMIPPTIGVLLGGLLTTIAIIFGIIKDEDLEKLNNKYGNSFFESLNNLKYHILFILFSLVVTLTAFFIKMPPLLIDYLSLIQLNPIQVFYFIQVFFILMTVYSAMEVINILFLIFEIKFILIKNKSKQR